MASAFVHIVGNLTRDPETKAVLDTSVTSLSIAVNRKYKEKESVSFIDCKAWGKTGEIIAQYLRKGNGISVRGDLVQENWEAKDGTKRSKLVVNVTAFDFLPKGGDNHDDDHASESRAKAAAVIPNALGSMDPLKDADIPF
jgi:single-strand DNA-binding protein